MATGSTLVALIGAGATPESELFIAALNKLPVDPNFSDNSFALPKAGSRIMSVRDAYFNKTEIVSAEQAIGRVSADSVAAYPPGIPNLLPGEQITSENVEFLKATVAAPFGHVRGGAAKDMSAFRVVK